jgi:hypothetical protein
MTVPASGSGSFKSSVGQWFELKSKYKLVNGGEGKRQRVNDEAGLRKDFEEFSKLIPNGKGSLIVIGFNDEESKIIELVSSDLSLKLKFKKESIVRGGESCTRYKWYKALLYSNEYSKLKIQMVS